MTHFDDYGEWGVRMQRARTLRDATDIAVGEVSRIVTGSHVRLVEEGRQARLDIRYAGGEPLASPQYLESNVMWLRKLLDLAVESVPALAVLPHRPAGMALLEAEFGPRLAVEAGSVAMVFDRDALELPLRPYCLPQQDGSERQHPIRTPLDTGRAVIRALAETILFDRPTAHVIAESLSLNLRTMQRHLAVWGVTFENVLDNYRQRMAVEYLQQKVLSVTDVALRLGYSDSAHFTRAFRRWTGRSPRQYLRDGPLRVVPPVAFVAPVRPSVEGVSDQEAGMGIVHLEPPVAVCAV
jgi:AraC-like DNA-binding protein